MDTHSTARHIDDEISLRDLYVIIKRAFVPAVIISLIVGAATFAYFSFQPKTYTTEATTVVTPLLAEPSFRLGGETLRVASGTTVSYEAYEAIAFSRRVLNEVLNAVPEIESSAPALRKALSISKLVGPSNAGQTTPLSVIHRVTHTNPTVAAQIADEWAASTIKTVSESMLDDLRPIVTATTDALAAAELQVEATEQRLSAFEESSSVSVLEQEYAALGEELRETSAALRQAEGERNSLATQLQSLETSLEEERVLALIDNVSVEAFLARAEDLIASNKMSDSPVFTAGLVVIGQSLLRSEQNAALRNAVATLEAHTTQAAIDSIRLTIAQQNGSPSLSANTMVRAVVDELRVAIFETRGYLTSTEAQIEHARAQVEWLEERMAGLRSELSEVRVMATDLHRDVELANEAYTSLARLEPLVGFFGELTPGNARILNTAFVPEEADKRSRLTATAIAIIVTGLLVIMFAFLREAVRDPQETEVLKRA